MYSQNKNEIFNGDRTYEIKRRIEGYKGDKVILIGLYPTIDGDNITQIDSTPVTGNGGKAGTA